MTYPGGSDTQLDRAVLKLVQRDTCASASWLTRRCERSLEEVRAAASRLVGEGLLEVARAGKREMEDCWCITEAGRAEP